MKVTPAHDASDYDCGKRHQLPLHVCMFNDDGTANRVAGVYVGTDRFTLRRIVLDLMRASGALKDVRPHPMRLAVCSRSGDVIEPMLKPQWYVCAHKLAMRAYEAAKNKEIVFSPSSFEDVWYQWMENCHDWCISRQLFWGHRVPAYFVWKTKEFNNRFRNDLKERWYAGTSHQHIVEQLATQFRIEQDEVARYFNIRQDEDVLDTWFSSALLPLSALGWPKIPVEELKGYPLSLMETGV